MRAIFRKFLSTSPSRSGPCDIKAIFWPVFVLRSGKIASTRPTSLLGNCSVRLTKSSILARSLIVCPLFGFAVIAQPTPPSGKTADVSQWKTFTNRAGWTIKHPSHWQVGSCRQCSDPTDPDVGFVTLYNPSRKELIMIEHLIDKPHDQTVEQWLQKMTMDLNPFISEEWISLNGTRALKVISRNADSTESENIYVVHGSKTFAIQAQRNMPSYPLYQRMLSTLRFTSR